MTVTCALVPVLAHGILSGATGARVIGPDGQEIALRPTGLPDRHALTLPAQTSDQTLPNQALPDQTQPSQTAQGQTAQSQTAPSQTPRGQTLPNATLVTPSGARIPLRAGSWAGEVTSTAFPHIHGTARDLHDPARRVWVVAFDSTGVVATTQTDAKGAFRLTLPATQARPVHLGITGSDHLLTTTPIRPPQPARALRPRQGADLAIRIKISTPNLKEAPMWGDWHFARALSDAFARQGRRAGVDTADAWYARTVDEDVMVMIRGRHRIRTQKGRINIMWLISHPDRIPDAEFADYDHVAVASDIYADILRQRGLPSVSVLHQAADPHQFTPPPAGQTRIASPLFVGNSRREYRTMVKWCLQERLPLELYGGGWEGILPPDLLGAQGVANADLGALYGRHLVVLNDHWDSMRENGFLSNRLFDAALTATPVLTDPVAGLTQVFGDTVAVACDRAEFAAMLRDCLADPAPWLARAEKAREIVLGAHTFDHRASALADLIDTIARKRGLAL